MTGNTPAPRLWRSEGRHVLASGFRFSGRFLPGAMGRARDNFRFGPFVLDVDEHTLTRAGAPVALTPKLFDLLRILVASEGRLLEKGDLMQAAWPDTVVEEGNLSKGVFLLRQALGDTGEDRTFIETVPRVGYR